MIVNDSKERKDRLKKKVKIITDKYEQSRKETHRRLIKKGKIIKD